MSRPIRHESEQRRREFARRVAAGESLKQAARGARIDPWRALELAESREMLDLLNAQNPGVQWETARGDAA